MASLVDQLLFSQKRPPAEAVRIAEAVTATLRNEEPGGGAAHAAEAAAVREVSAIAAEKRPRRRGPVSDHAAQFADYSELLPQPSLFRDEPRQAYNHRVEPVYLLQTDRSEPAVAAAEPSKRRRRLWVVVTAVAAVVVLIHGCGRDEPRLAVPRDSVVTSSYGMP